MRKNRMPKKNSIISWIIIGLGAISALLGALIVHDYGINLLLCMGGLIVIIGIVYHLIMVRCPYCGHSLAGYRPLPDTCPKCHRDFNADNKL